MGEIGSFGQTAGDELQVMLSFKCSYDRLSCVSLSLYLFSVCNHLDSYVSICRDVFDAS